MHLLFQCVENDRKHLGLGGVSETGKELQRVLRFDAQFDELRIERRLAGNPDLARAEFFYWTRKLQARFLAGDYLSAVNATTQAQSLFWIAKFLVEAAEYHFYGALSRAAFCDSIASDQRVLHLEALAAHHKRREIWAEHCPENFKNRSALVSAEVARIEGCNLDAMRLYEQAIRSARANGFIHNKALANQPASMPGFRNSRIAIREILPTTSDLSRATDHAARRRSPLGFGLRP